MPNFDFDIAIIGGGAAGLTVASGSAQLGARTLLIEREPMLGGDCLHFGCVPSKTLIRSAHVYHMMKHTTNYGLPTMDVPPVDFSQITKRIKGVIDTIQVHDSVERFCGLGVQVEFGEAEFIDEHSVRLNGKTVSAAKWVVASGSSPSHPSIDGLDDLGYITNKEIFSLPQLPPSMVFLGGGPIAMELAQAFSRLGSKVTVIQRGAHILSNEDPDMSDVLLEQMTADGIDFYLGTRIISVGKAGQSKEVRFMHGDEEKRVTASELVVAMGRSANIDGLALDSIGINASARGITVDSRLRTSHKHIFAAGDVTGQYQFTHAAGYEGGVIVSNAIFRLPRKVDYTNMPWCTYTAPELASIGHNERTAKAAGIEYKLWTEEFSANDRALTESETVGKVKLLLDSKEKPLGVQILGPHAGELAGHWIAAMNGKVKLSTLAGAIHPYPTLGEINKRVVGSIFTEKIFSEKVKRGLKFFFNLKGGGRPPCQ
jgi:pyruvate/2-oxoglutarate dehydrogenase complex dihydrolipoamide dehydrogenase (E3) component